MVPSYFAVARFRHRCARRAAIVSITLIVPFGACARDAALPVITAAAHQTAWDTWKASRTAWLSIPGRPVSYTGLRWIHEGANTIGSSLANAILLTGRDVPALAGTLVREGHRVRFEPAPGVNALIDSVPATAQWVRTDADSGKPSRIDVGSAGFRVVRRVDSVGVRTFDVDKANASTIAPLTYFPLDPMWRVAGKFVAAAKPDTQAVPTTAGVAEVHIILGNVTATVSGKSHTFLAFAGNSPTDLYFTFSDETSGEETYGFRFLHAALDPVSNVVTFDLNYAYNPDCAFSKFTTCPLPPTQNRVPVRITAGEKIVQHLAESVKTASK